MKTCKRCGEELKLTLTPGIIHYGRLDCPSCKKFYGWEKKPQHVCKDCGEILKTATTSRCECGAYLCKDCAYESDGLFFCEECYERKKEGEKDERRL